MKLDIDIEVGRKRRGKRRGEGRGERRGNNGVIDHK